MRGDNCPAGPDCNDADMTIWEELPGFLDLDGDQSTVGEAQIFCTDGALPPNYIATASILDDCNDNLTEASSLLSETDEVCDGLDNDCDGTVDQKLAGTDPCPCTVSEFGGHAYQICPEKDHVDAAYACGLMGYHLIDIGSDSEHLFAEGLADSFALNEYVWIGGTDTANEGQWLQSDGSAFAYTNWEPGGEPNNALRSTDYTQVGEDCAMLMDDNRLWHDLWCDLAQPFIGEADPQRDSLNIVPLPTPLFEDTFTQLGGELDGARWYPSRTGGDESITVGSGALFMDFGNDADDAIQLVARGMPSVQHSEATFNFHFESTDKNRLFRIFLKGSGLWDGATGHHPKDGYSVEFGPDNDLKLRKWSGGVPVTLDSSSEDLKTDIWSVKIQVDGSGVRAKIWKATEPGIWTMSSTDTSITPPGRLYMMGSNTANTAHALHLDDVLVSELAP
jgi:hypothetical protein